MSHWPFFYKSYCFICALLLASYALLLTIYALLLTMHLRPAIGDLLLVTSIRPASPASGHLGPASGHLRLASGNLLPASVCVYPV